MHSYLKTKYEEKKQFVKKHRVSIACSVTAVATYVVLRDHGAHKVIKQLNRETLHENLEHLAMHDFLATNNQLQEFENFRKEFGL